MSNNLFVLQKECKAGSELKKWKKIRAMKSS